MKTVTLTLTDEQIACILKQVDIATAPATKPRKSFRDTLTQKMRVLLNEYMADNPGAVISNRALEIHAIVNKKEFKTNTMSIVLSEAVENGVLLRLSKTSYRKA